MHDNIYDQEIITIIDELKNKIDRKTKNNISHELDQLCYYVSVRTNLIQDLVNNISILKNKLNALSDALDDMDEF